MPPSLGHSWPPYLLLGSSCHPARPMVTRPVMVPRGWWCPHTCPLNAAVCCSGWSPAGTVCSPSCLSADCSQPLDVALLLDGSSGFPASYFDEMKSFAKAFISKANIGE